MIEYLPVLKVAAVGFGWVAFFFFGIALGYLIGVGSVQFVEAVLKRLEIETNTFFEGCRDIAAVLGVIGALLVIVVAAYRFHSL